MNHKLSGFIVRQKIITVIREIMYPLLALGFVVFFLYQWYVTYAAMSTLDTERDTRTTLEQSLTAIYSSQPVDDTELQQYTLAYATQIPEHDDVFAVASAVDDLVQSTGLQLLEFRPPAIGEVRALKGPSSQATLVVSGTQAQFDTFISLYHLGTTRFMTIDTISMDTSTDTIKASVTLNFYTAPIVRDPAHLVTFTQAHKAHFEKIKNQIPLDKFTTVTNVSAPPSYDTVQPF